MTEQVETELLGVKVLAGRGEDVLKKIWETGSSESIAVYSVNAEILIQAREDDGLGEAIQKNPWNIADGYWVAKLLSAKYGKGTERLAGADLVLRLIERAAMEDKGVLLLGGSGEVLTKAIGRLRDKWPALRLTADCLGAVTATGEMDRAAEDRVWALVQKFKPHLVLVGLGAPKQELWIRRNKKILGHRGCGVSVACGGSIDFISGSSMRAPLILQKNGLEWLFRLIREPGRFSRQVKRLPKFAVLSILELVRYRAAVKD